MLAAPVPATNVQEGKNGEDVERSSRSVQEENSDEEEKKIRTKDYLTRSRDCHFLRTLAIIALEE